MKKATLTLVMAFAVIAGYSQLTKVDVKERQIGCFKRVGQVYGKLMETVIEGDTSYSILYHNDSYSQIIDFETITFKKWNTVTDFYLALKDQFTKDKGQESTLIVDGETIMLHTDRILGKKYVNIYATVGHTMITERDLKSLFNIR